MEILLRLAEDLHPDRHRRGGRLATTWGAARQYIFDVGTGFIDRRIVRHRTDSDLSRPAFARLGGVHPPAGRQRTVRSTGHSGDAQAAVGGLFGLMGLIMMTATDVPSFYGNGYRHHQSAGRLPARSTGRHVGALACSGDCCCCSRSPAPASPSARRRACSPSSSSEAALGGLLECPGIGRLAAQRFPSPSRPRGHGAGGATYAPLTAILIVYELTQSYQVILPLMFAAVISTVVARAMNRNSIYTSRLRDMGIRVGSG